MHNQLPLKHNSVFSLVLLLTEYRTLFCLNFLGCPNYVIPFGLEEIIIWRFYVAVNPINILRLLYVKVQFSPHREHHVSVVSSVRDQLNIYVPGRQCQQSNP